MSFTPLTKVASRNNLTPDTLHRAHMHEMPEWMEKRAGRYYIDETSKQFKIWIRKKKRKSQLVSAGRAKAKRRKEIREGGDAVLGRADTERLQELSIQADLSSPIVKLRLEKYKIEGQKLNLEKQAGQLMEYSLAQFLFTGYLERLNRENLQYQNKIQGDIEKMLSELIAKHVFSSLPKDFPPELKEGVEEALGFLPSKEIAKAVSKLITTEQEEIIRNVKKAQKTALLKWAQDNGVDYE